MVDILKTIWEGIVSGENKTLTPKQGENEYAKCISSTSRQGQVQSVN